MRAACIRAVCPRTWVTIVSGPIGAAILMQLIIHDGSAVRAVSWFLTVVATRMLARSREQRFALQADDPTPRQRWAFFGAQTFHGIVWGTGPWVLQLHQERSQVAFFVVMMVVVLVAMAAMSSYLPCAIAFTWPIVASVSALPRATASYRSPGVIVGVLVICGLGLRYAIEAYRTFIGSVESQREVARLVVELDTARLQVERTNASLLATNDRLNEMARRDSLTSLLNRRAMTERLEALRGPAGWSRSWFYAVFDIDHFKSINDTYGHLAGDQALVAVAQTMAEQIRAADCLARIGGEEFGLLIVDATYEDALQMVERVLRSVEALDSDVGQVTVSAGMARGRGDIEELYAAADAALYEAKRTGRNRLIAA